MKSIYRRHLRDVLDLEVPDALPGFAFTPLKLSKEERRNATLFEGSCLYSRRVAQGTMFVQFIPHRRQESFQAEVGWSVSGRFPSALTSHGPLKQPANELLEPDWLIDFGQLYHRKYGRGFLGWDVWQCSVPYDHPDFLRIFVEEDLVPVLDDEARDRVAAAVATCLRDVKDVAVPYLDQWLAVRHADAG